MTNINWEDRKEIEKMNRICIYALYQSCGTTLRRNLSTFHFNSFNVSLLHS